MQAFKKKLHEFLIVLYHLHMSVNYLEKYKK